MQPKTDEAPFARRSPLGAFLKSEAAGGVLLMISAALAWRRSISRRWAAMSPA